MLLSYALSILAVTTTLSIAYPQAPSLGQIAGSGELQGETYPKEGKPAHLPRRPGQFGTCKQVVKSQNAKANVCAILSPPGANMFGKGAGGRGARIECADSSPCEHDYDDCFIEDGKKHALCQLN